GVGVLLGTAAYMAPEQARGRVVDKRSDIWAFGCVLFEVLTATRPFVGEDVTETVAAVVKSDPEWNLLPRDVPPGVVALLKACLVKDPRKRAGDIAVARFVFDHGVTPDQQRHAQPSWRRPSARIAGYAVITMLSLALT